METGMGLPNDALTDILGRLPARSLATSRRVCRAWRAAVDAGGLLLRQALPHAVRGVYLNLVDYRRPRFFARRSTSTTGPRIDGDLGYLPAYMGSHSPVRDHCNGLVLCGRDWVFDVVNTATRPPRVDARGHDAHLVFDPAASPHYEVLLVPPVPEKPDPFDLIEFLSLLDDMSASDGTESPPPYPPLDFRLMEWPPSPCTLLVFSSMTGQWQERPFAREGEAMGTVADALLDSPGPGVMYLWPRWRYGVYWRGELYIHYICWQIARQMQSN